MGFCDLTGKVAVVTGASRGLGREDALTLARQGADVVITDILIEDDPDLEATAEGANSFLMQAAAQQGWVYSNATAEEIRHMGRRSTAIKMDVTNREQVAQVFKQVKEEFGRIDILINNAATLDNTAQIEKMDYRLWDRDLLVNLTGSFNCAKEAFPYMREQNWGRIVFMASVAGTIGGFGQSSYSATKAGVIGLARTVAPMYERFKNRTVFKRFGQPADIANAIVFLCSEEAGYITGTTLEVAGGIPLFTA